ncbi:MAG: sigma-54-dependent Fis family transcriptional regulator [Burkholderiales bacterium]|nr:sigma-54-dependent Fis family transcriptional regulator [Burkholderiales bacterium]
MAHAVLIVDDELTLARNLAAYLERHGFEVRVAGSGEDGLQQAATYRPDIVLLDHNLPGISGLEVLQRLHAADAQAPVVMMTGYGGVELAVEAMKLGAADYLTKPVSLAELKLLIERLLQHNRLEQAVGYYRRRDAEGSGLDEIIGASPAIDALRAALGRLLEAERRLVDADAPAVLIHGETGTGKELVARALHYGGLRASRPFVELNCGALPPNLIEAELFGYEKGAFTDARQRKPGLVEAADGGTLFLDEIGEADPATQVKLLKLLEEKRFRRLGGLRDQQVNVRIVSATHQPLDRMVQERRFRADLYFRLRIVEVAVPPLRERGDDVRLLARHFLQHHARRYRRGELRLSPAAQAGLSRHAWPGNVRELRNVIEQAVLMSTGAEIGVAHLAFAAIARGEGADPDDLNLERTERRLIERALQRSGGNVTQAARLLGVSRDTLRYRLERAGQRLQDDEA